MEEIFMELAYLYIDVTFYQKMKAHGGCECKGPHIHSHGTRMR